MPVREDANARARQHPGVVQCVARAVARARSGYFFRSKRSAFITFVQAATKSFTIFRSLPASA